MQAQAVLFEAPKRLSLATIALRDPQPDEVVVAVRWSGVSTGTERLLWQGDMPPFPGLGYPLVPGYEAVGEIVDASPGAERQVGQRVFVPGSQGFVDARGLFGASASHLVVPAQRTQPVATALERDGVLLALAATAYHALAGGVHPELVIGHGVLGRLIGRLVVALGGEAPVFWETASSRIAGAEGWTVTDAATDARRDYRTIMDCSGDAGLIDTLVNRLARGGELVLAGFYKAPVSFTYPPAFMRELRLRIAAEWQPADLAAVSALVDDGRLSLAGLVSHIEPAAAAGRAYATAFDDPACLKMVLDWTHAQ